MPSVLTQYAGKLFVVSYKLNGSSITIIHSHVFGRSRFRICSRHFELHNKHNAWYQAFVDTHFAQEILKLVYHYRTPDIIVQGEAIGKFNDNPHKLQYDQIRLFNIYVHGKRLNQREFIAVCLSLDIPHCPMYKEIVLAHTLPDMLKESEIPDPLNPSIGVEGLVWRCVEDNLSFKVLNNSFLLQHEE